MHCARYVKNVFLICCIFLLESSCCPPKTLAYLQQYAHLKAHKPTRVERDLPVYSLSIFVSARHLDYSDGGKLLQTIAKHPDGSKNRDVGHAWIALSGRIQGKPILIEGGHSGETGSVQARYFEGIMNAIDYGSPNPSSFYKHCKDISPNPVSYLWAAQRDGFFQRGSGGHRPTYGARFTLTQEQFFAILSFIDPSHYDYTTYSLTGNQCTTFAAYAAKIACVELSCEVTVKIPKILRFGAKRYVLWTSDEFSQITIATPDILEKSLMQAVDNGLAEYILK